MQIWKYTKHARMLWNVFVWSRYSEANLKEERWHFWEMHAFYCVSVSWIFMLRRPDEIIFRNNGFSLHDQLSPYSNNNREQWGKNILTLFYLDSRKRFKQFCMSCDFQSTKSVRWRRRVDQNIPRNTHSHTSLATNFIYISLG